MSFGPLHDPVVEVASTLEVRWILSGRPRVALVEWFGRLSATTESREDAYLVYPRLEGLSVKIRGGARLEVKVDLGRSGIVDVPGRARGRLNSWCKWSFPIGSTSQLVSGSSDWRPVRKDRSISWFSATGQPLPGPADGLDDPACKVELTDIMIGGDNWWTLGFEATGPADQRRGALEATAATIFGEAMPEAVRLGIDHSVPYSQWLQHR